MPGLSWFMKQKKRDRISILGGIVVAVLALAVVSVAVKASPSLVDDSALIYDDGLRVALGNGSPAGRLTTGPVDRHLPVLSRFVPGGHIIVAACPGFIDAARNGEVQPEWASIPGARRYADCLALTVLGFARRPRQFLAPGDGLGRVLAERLVLSSLAEATLGFIPSGALAGALAGAGEQTAIARPDTVVQARAVEVTIGAARWRLEVAASADVRELGLEDLVVKVSRIDDREAAVGYAVIIDDGAGALRGMPVSRVLAIEGSGFGTNQPIPQID
ncbi:MAG: hypothetical protein P4M00_19845 [Azospirillaceae bacterium]|nr:hypothetical protein [Azospirillaceae bacterium]